MKYIKEPARDIPVLDETDVIIVGGGLSGIAAAIAAARVGAETMLIERNGILGGVATAGMMSSTTNWFTDPRGKLILRGIALELMEKLVDMEGTIPQWKEVELPHLPFDQEIFRYVLVDMVQEAGVNVLLHSFVSDLLIKNQRVNAIIIENKSGRGVLRGKIVVDATGDADIVAKTGAPFEYNPPGSNSLEFLVDDVNMQKTFEFFRQNRKKWKPPENQDLRWGYEETYEEFERNWTQRGVFHLPHGGGCIENSPLWVLVQKAVEEGDYARTKGNCVRLDAFGFFGLRMNKTTVVNTGFFENVDELNTKEISKIEMEARSFVPYVADFLRKYIPGFEKAKVVASASDLGIRVTRWIEGEYILTVDDQLGEARFDDVVGTLPLTQFWLARHTPKEQLCNRGKRPKVRKKERRFDVPYQCMLPKKLENVIVASGKSVSTNPRAILREQGPCLLLGQAAGTAAALAAKQSAPPRETNMRDLQQTLLDQNVYLGDESRLAELGLK